MIGMRSNKSMKFNIVTIFPNELSQSLSYGVIGNAIRDNIIKINFFDPRIHADNKHDSIKLIFLTQGSMLIISMIQ